MADLERFVLAQEYNYEQALSEIRHGKKTSCWMWYIFPQIRGLGQSYMAKKFEIEDIKEAKEYLKHPVLGKRLIEMCNAVLQIQSDNPGEVFGFPDNMKLCSSMTLFEQADPANSVFGQVLDKFFKGKRDEKTLELLNEK